MSKSNFAFLKDKWPILANTGEMAEKSLHTDPNTTLFKLRLFAEIITEHMFAYESLEEPRDGRQVVRLGILRKEDLLPTEIDDIFNRLRRVGNKATHEGYGSVKEAKLLLSLAYKLGVWFMQLYGEWSYEPEDFVVPEDEQTKLEELRAMQELYEKQNQQLTSELEELRKVKVSQEVATKRRENAFLAATRMELTEEETRTIIDDKLRAMGWEVDSEQLTYANGTRPKEEKNLAIAEWPAQGGHADYALFVGLKMVGLVEAKKRSKDVLSVLEQAKRYGKTIKFTNEAEKVRSYGEYQVPFLFATNGRPYLEQIKEKSGIWFLDARQTTNYPRPLKNWYTPEGLLDLLEKDEAKANQKLANESFDYLTDPNGLSLRYYQLDGIREVEDAIANDQRNMLLAMATGTGKTRTTIGLVYRLIKAKRFKRILFLVDRTSLGEQALNAFQESTIESLQTFNQIYDIKELGDKVPDLTTKFHIATVQGMVHRLYSADPDAQPAVDWYDCIIVDEAHRGYVLDKEMSEEELQFRNEQDYVSKYRQVLDYFDATRIGLTATPATHTVEIFGKPVYSYSYREAVIDGYLVDHEPPHIIETRLKKEGIKWKEGEKIPLFDPITGTVTNSDELPDEVVIEVDKFNKDVITENFNRTVIGELVKYIDPEGPEKTLVFAATDNHADMVVNIFKDEYEKAGIPFNDDAILKITGSIDDSSQAIRNYKNENDPTIVVTVDLLTTGIDVPAIANLVFLRRVRSRILYEQMLGRATRLCDKFDKPLFTIFDAVGIYDTLEEVSTMKPVVKQPQISSTQLVDELEEMGDQDQQKYQIDQVIAKLQRRKQTLKQIDKDQMEIMTGQPTIDQFIMNLRQMPTEDAVQEVLAKRDFFEFIDKYKFSAGKGKLISHHTDELVSHTRGYGKGEKPEDYLEEFKTFISENMNTLPALQIVCQRPQELSRQELKELKLELDKHGFSESQLNVAWNEMKNEDIVADIISFIRQHALGDPLIRHEERIQKAVSKIKKMHNWTKIQEKWLDRIEKQLIQETIVDKQAFDHEPFKSKGGFDAVDKVFEGKLDKILEDINKLLYTTKELA